MIWLDTLTPRAQVPLDGIVAYGSAFVSLENITGESLPVAKDVGDEVPAGAQNNDGLLVVRPLSPAECRAHACARIGPALTQLGCTLLHAR